jgi:hypothetical protein
LNRTDGAGVFYGLLKPITAPDVRTARSLTVCESSFAYGVARQLSGRLGVGANKVKRPS